MTNLQGHTQSHVQKLSLKSPINLEALLLNHQGDGKFLSKVSIRISLQAIICDVTQTIRK
jgi:hypothetical protein